MLTLQKLGFTNAYALLGGLGAWTFAKYPTDTAPPDAAPDFPPPAQTQPQPQPQTPTPQPH